MLLIIDNYDSFTFNLDQAFQALDLPTKVVRNDQIKLKDISRIKPLGIVLSPGPGRPEDAGICIDLIKKFSSKTPILGVCLGHQAIAYAFGGNITFANHIFHGKKSIIFHKRTRLFQNMPLPFVAGRYHSLMVDKKTLPSEFEIEAETTDGTIMAIRHRKYLSFGAQFHPESILTPEGHIFLKNFVQICRGHHAQCSA
jgi:anthranilate synthase component II